MERISCHAEKDEHESGESERIFFIRSRNTQIYRNHAAGGIHGDNKVTQEGGIHRKGGNTQEGGIHGKGEMGGTDNGEIMIGKGGERGDNGKGGGEKGGVL